MNLKLMRLICLLFVVNLTAQNVSPCETPIIEPFWYFNEDDVPQPSRWMSSLPDYTLVSDLDIPGTHNSAALHEPLSNTAKNQDFTIVQQLNMGVRYLDIRCRMIDNKFTIHHGVAYQYMNYDDVLTKCLDFLRKNPKETILMHVKQEHSVENCSLSFEQIFADYVRRYPDLFYRDSKIPTLGEARGRIVLVRRFGWDNNKTSDVPCFGIWAQPWGDNTPYQTWNTGWGDDKVYLQDCYRHTNSACDKWGYVWDFHKKIINKQNFPRTLILNYLSGTLKHWTDLAGQAPRIKDMAYYTNGKMYNHLLHQMAKYHQNGVVICDYVDPNFARAVYKNNFWTNVDADFDKTAIIFRNNPTEHHDNAIRVYENPGMFDAYALSDLQWLGYENDTASGITVAANASEVRIFDHFNLSGDSQIILRGHTYLTNMNDRVSSLRFYKPLATNPFARTNGESENYADSKLPNLDFKVYPNPTNGIFNIEFTSKMDVSKIEVYDEKGSLILSKDKEELGNTIDITKQSKGMYIVKIYTKKDTIVKKIIRS